MHDEIKKPSLETVKQIKEDLISAVKFATSQGVFSKEVDTKEMGEVIDMIKDLAETERNCWEACYYHTVVKAMNEHGEGGYPMGYNSNRYSDGRYAPSGTGNRTSGYDKMPITSSGNDVTWGNDYDHHMLPMMGYSRMDNINDPRNQYGSAYKEYEDAKRHYTETRSMEDRDHMDKKALEHMNNSMMTLREIWKDADPEVKKEVSSSISSLASEFKSL